jgi:NADP-dependent 3-hydroxy acid dehydrogenase YdfG
MAQSTAVFSPQLFAGHTVFVSGGGSGIGKAIARAFLATGARVWIASRKEERLQEAVRELQEYGECHYAVLDIRDTEAIDNVVQQIRDKGHNIDILINNAGGQFPSPAEDISANGWHAVINNNLNGTWFMTKAFASNFFMQQHQGIVISIIANIYRGFPGMAYRCRKGRRGKPYQIVICGMGALQYPPQCAGARHYKNRGAGPVPLGFSEGHRNEDPYETHGHT